MTYQAWSSSLTCHKLLFAIYKPPYTADISRLWSWYDACKAREAVLIHGQRSCRSCSKGIIVWKGHWTKFVPYTSAAVIRRVFLLQAWSCCHICFFHAIRQSGLVVFANLGLYFLPIMVRFLTCVTCVYCVALPIDAEGWSYNRV